MKKSFLLFTCVLLSLVVAQTALAEIKLPAIVSSNMVLQRNTTIVLWGWADAKEKISIEASWLSEPIKIDTDKSGNWKTEVKTTNSKSPQTIKIAGKSSNVTLENVLFGEVWLCSGQSNMQQPINGYNGQPTFGTIMTTATSKNPNLRLFTVDRVGSKTPLVDVDKYTGWQEAAPANVLEFSAIAYYFGQKLQKILDVPVGMIHTSWGGSSVEAWISKDVISNYQEVNLDDVDITKGTNHIPSALYNAMINPLIPYTIRGSLWYQGESNRSEPKKYEVLFPAMVKDWRTRWDIGDFPFYYVQIAPYWYNDLDAFNTYENSAFIRESQFTCLNLIPNSGVALTMDLGKEKSIHPPQKEEVADRLLYNALNKTYGIKSIDYSGPTYSTHEIKDGAIILSFENAETGIYAFDGLTDFEIAGEDKVFYPASANIIRGRNVQVKSDEVPNPVAVRYAWKNWVMGTLYDTNLLPAPSFRTDDWDDAKRAE